MFSILLGSTNKGKFIEMSESLTGLPITLVTPEAVDIQDSPEEHGNTFKANALEKAQFYWQKSGLPTLADDSGILVEALKEELGIHTRRWGAGKDATDEEWIAYFLDRMRTEKNKQATFTCVLCFIDSGGTEHFFEGNNTGRITDELEAMYLPGLPLSACFKPDGQRNVYSALSMEEKNTISHRGKALAQFKTFLQEMLTAQEV